MTAAVHDQCKHLLSETNTILLVDWQNKNIPITLAKAGFNVISYSPLQYCDVAIGSVNGIDELIFKPLTQMPQVDVVYVYRPEGEHAAIIQEHVLPLGAKVFWLHPPLTSAATGQLAASEGLTYIEGVDITSVISG
jgi:predicted CoA-binding protein